MPIRLSGMASGLDTDTLIKELMQAQRTPLNKLIQEKQTIAWKRESYRETNTALTSIRNLVEKMRFSNAFNKQSASSSDNSVVTATASSTASSGSFAIRVDSLASSALIAGDKVTVDLKSKINTPGSFEIVGPNGSKSVQITADSTYESVMKQVNGSNIGVTMSYDSINGRFMLSSNTTGKTSTILVNDDSSSTAAQFFGLTTMVDTTDQDGNPIRENRAVAGSNALVQVNGKNMEIENNAFEFNGVRFDLKGVSNTTVSVTVAKDTSNIVDQIKSFVEQYNSLVDLVNDKTKSTPNRNYTPLTDEQKESMSEKQIDLWESKAKSGLLYRDDILQETLSALHSALVNNVSGLKDEMNSLSDIGITFKKYTTGLKTTELGKLEIDETKLNEAVTNDPDGIMRLFTKTSSLDPKDSAYQSQIGYAERLYTTLTNSVNKIIKRIGSGTVADAVDGSQLGQKIDTINDRMSTMEARLKMIEDRYYKQFTAMELAMQKLNNKSSWLMSQLYS
ncbi:flagellar hook-associated protein 2 [Paenibacillus sp. JCM 10914]|uniref:flagellar filament capping protein FliD n=1 Tax=Paenibacillus sp. JCM 10914 TaxID=1236974 RepID=UPI0003CC2BC5|nr:flagellar filament capping protein FliD [Paenibacillus sp. JCM 10914]GAE09103.1 flagellar hook-associated protein FliD [Paenibacillus sp. JCM 10914]